MLVLQGGFLNALICLNVKRKMALWVRVLTWFVVVEVGSCWCVLCSVWFGVEVGYCWCIPSSVCFGGGWRLHVPVMDVECREERCPSAVCGFVYVVL